MKRRLFLYLLLAASLAVVPAAAGVQDGKEAAYETVRGYLGAKTPSRPVLASEGEFITVFNDGVADWIKEPLTAELTEEILSVLEPNLMIDLSPRGFASAATRSSGGKDETHYDAVWVRDSVWIYYSFLTDPARRDDARKLLLALWDYYATDAQVGRFKAVIADPSLSTDQMAMPHIRFDGNSPDLGDVMIDGKPQVWNHRQIDAHGIFFTALGEALSSGLVAADEMTDRRLAVLALYPRFLDRIRFETYEDAGAWEEIPRRNTSSIALAARSLEVWKKLIYGSAAAPEGVAERFTAMLAAAPADAASAWSEDSLTALIERGLGTVRYQLKLGGESPDYPPEDIHFRLADAALVVLIQPSPLEGLTEEEMRKALLIIETLKRPAGVLRYNNDSYQSGNFWIRQPAAVASGKPAAGASDKPAPTGDTSSREAFLWRLGQLIPDTEAEWFFDSLLAMAHLHLAEMADDPQLKAEDLHAAAIHIKRALGQITGEGQITADGRTVTAWQLPESVNTVVIDGDRRYLASPIVPLNWAKAAMAMALRKYRDVETAPEGRQTQ